MFNINIYKIILKKKTFECDGWCFSWVQHIYGRRNEGKGAMKLNSVYKNSMLASFCRGQETFELHYGHQESRAHT